MYKLNDAFDDLVTTMNLKYSKTSPIVTRWIYQKL